MYTEQRKYCARYYIIFIGKLWRVTWRVKCARIGDGKGLVMCTIYALFSTTYRINMQDVTIFTVNTNISVDVYRSEYYSLRSARGTDWIIVILYYMKNLWIMNKFFIKFPDLVVIVRVARYRAAGIVVVWGQEGWRDGFVSLTGWMYIKYHRGNAPKSEEWVDKRTSKNDKYYVREIR